MFRWSIKFLPLRSPSRWTPQLKHIRLYVDDKYKRTKSLWNHPAGPKTVFFWAPLAKWGLVIAGIADSSRDPAALSEWQTLSIAVSGTIWSRYSFVITPKNYLLFSVNFFVAVSQWYQIYRIYVWEELHLAKDKK